MVYWLLFIEGNNMFTRNLLLKKYVLEFWQNLCIIFTFIWIIKEGVKML
jgi:hypothetical protein